MATLQTTLKDTLEQLYSTTNIYVAVFLIFSYHFLLEGDFSCSCQRHNYQCISYIAMPSVALTVFMFVTDRAFQRYCKYYFSTCSYRFCCTLLYQIAKALFIGNLWIVSVLFDGDWWVCCMNHSEKQQQIACKNKKNITAEEEAIITDLKFMSMVGSIFFL